MPVDEFIKKLLAGKRDFRGISAVGYNLFGHERYGELRTYLRGQDLQNHPIAVSGSCFSHLKAAGVYFP